MNSNRHSPARFGVLTLAGFSVLLLCFWRRISRSYGVVDVANSLSHAAHPVLRPDCRLAPAEQDHAARHSHLVIACHFWRPNRHQVRLHRIVRPPRRFAKKEPFYLVMVTRGNASLRASTEACRSCHPFSCEDSVMI